MHLEELVQQAVEREPALIGTDAIAGQQGCNPTGVAIVVDQAACGQRQVLATISHTQPAAIDETAEAAVDRHQIRQACIAVRYHQIFIRRARCDQLGMHLLGALAQAERTRVAESAVAMFLGFYAV